MEDNGSTQECDAYYGVSNNSFENLFVHLSKKCARIINVDYLASTVAGISAGGVNIRVYNPHPTR